MTRMTLILFAAKRHKNRKQWGERTCEPLQTRNPRPQIGVKPRMNADERGLINHEKHE